MKKYIILLSILIPLITTMACNKGNASDKGNVSKPQFLKHKIKNVVILGNSIVAHPPYLEIGWNADWGMAASARDSDFVHLLISNIHKKDPSVTIRYTSISAFERDYDTYDLTQLETFRNADMLIMRISENVNSETSIARNFALHYDNLIKYLAPADSTVKIITDGFWPSPINDIIKNYAVKNSYPFVSLYDLYHNDITNSAKGLFGNVGVASHPSDKGMRNITVRIWTCIVKYFPNN